LAYQLLRDAYHWFLGVQLLLALSLYLAYRVYRSLIRPLELVSGGSAALRDRDFTVKYRPTGTPELDALIAVYNDMIDNLRGERTQTQEQHFFLRKLIQASPTGILILDYDGNLSEVNPRAAELLGVRDPLRAVSDAPADHPLLAMARELSIGQQRTIRTEGVGRYRIEVSGFVDRGFNRKFVQIQELSQDILAAEKRAYGKVIRMMAHEVNNSIGAINAILQTLADPEAPTDADWAEDVRQSLPVAIQRNERLNTFMRNFADVVRLPDPRRERIDLNELLANTTRLFRSQAEQRAIEITCQGSDTPVYASVDPQQIEQVLVNVVKNALESIDREGKVVLQLTSQPIGFQVLDNGPGIPAAAADQLFTPFFSTKSSGQGIGLTLVREILVNHGARFSLQTEADGWTRFQVAF
jgi:nitrogen fixation/metabolism regulation signal transduction histidine kinase